MRNETKPKLLARVIIDIAFLLSLNSVDESEQVFSSVGADFIAKGIVNFFTQHGILKNEVEFIILTHSAYHLDGKFNKILTDEHSIRISYETFEDHLFQKNESGEFQQNHIASLWRLAQRAPYIIPGETLFDQLLTRVEILIREISHLKEPGPSLEKKLAQLRKTLQTLHLFFECAFKPEAREGKSSAAYRQLLRLKNENTDLARNIPAIIALLSTLKELREHFVKIPLVLNPRLLKDFDQNQEEPATLLLLSHATCVSNKFPSHFFVQRSFRAGEPSPRDLTELSDFLNAHRRDSKKHAKSLVYADFDYTACINSLARFTQNIRDAVNPHLIPIFNMMREYINNTRFQILTSRPPLHKPINDLLKKTLNLFNSLHTFNLGCDTDFYFRLNRSRVELNALIAQKRDLHEEISTLKKISSKLGELEHFDKLILNPDPLPAHLLPKKLPILVWLTIQSIKVEYSFLAQTMSLLCVSSVSDLYRKEHKIPIEISNELHLARSETKLFKGPYLAKKHTEETSSTLVVALEDSPAEIKEFELNTGSLDLDGIERKLLKAKSATLNSAVDVKWVTIHHEGTIPRHEGSTVWKFFEEVAHRKAEQNFTDRWGSPREESNESISQESGELRL